MYILVETFAHCIGCQTQTLFKYQEVLTCSSFSNLWCSQNSDSFNFHLSILADGIWLVRVTGETNLDKQTVKEIDSNFSFSRTKWKIYYWISFGFHFAVNITLISVVLTLKNSKTCVIMLWSKPARDECRSKAKRSTDFLSAFLSRKCRVNFTDSKPHNPVSVSKTFWKSSFVLNKRFLLKKVSFVDSVDGLYVLRLKGKTFGRGFIMELQKSGWQRAKI